MTTKPMSPEERVEAALRIMDEWLYEETPAFREAISRALVAAYPELADGTHVLVPREPTEEMLDAGWGLHAPQLIAAEAYDAMLTAYESSTKTDPE